MNLNYILDQWVYFCDQVLLIYENTFDLMDNN